MYEIRAKQAYDEIIEISGRPTRPLRLQPTWNITHRDGLAYITDTNGKHLRTLLSTIDPMSDHWSNEREHFNEELDMWLKFQKYQQGVQHLNRLETDLELDNTDAGLIKVLTQLNEWQELEKFQRLVIGDDVSFKEKCRSDFLWITSWDTDKDPQTISMVHNAIDTWLRRMDRCQEYLEASKNRLEWIKSAWPNVVAEAVDMISKTPELQPVLEATFRTQTHAAFTTILKLGGRPSHAVNPPDKSMDDLDRILYWTSETSKYTEELSDWKKFLNWRQQNLGDSPTTKEQEFRYPKFKSSPDYFAAFENFRSFEYEIALTWLKCWQRVVRWYEEEMGIKKSKDPSSFPPALGSYAKAARLRVRESEQELADAAMRLEKSKREHGHALSQHGQTTGGEIIVTQAQKPSPSTTPLPKLESSHSSQSSSSPPQLSLSPPSPQSSQSSQPSQPPPSPKRLCKGLCEDRSPSVKSSFAQKRHLRSREGVKKWRAKKGKTNTEQQAHPTFSLSPHKVHEEDDTQMTDTSEDSAPVEVIHENERAESEDTVMTDFEDSDNHNPLSSAVSHSRLITNTASLELPTVNCQSPTLRKTRSATKLDQAFSGEGPKELGKTFTGQPMMELSNAASKTISPTGSPPLRRSERRMEKAAASAAITHSHLGVNSPHQPSEQKQPQTKPTIKKTSRQSRQKKLMVQRNELEPPQTSGQKKSKIIRDAIESSRSSRQQKLQKRARDAGRLGS